MDHRLNDPAHIASCEECQARIALQAPDVDLERSWTQLAGQLATTGARSADRMISRVSEKESHDMDAASLVTPVRVLPAGTPNGYTQTAALPMPARPADVDGARRWLSIIAAAAVVLAVLGGFFVGRHTNFAGPDATERPPAILAPGTPAAAAGLDDATLLDVFFPPELLPTREERVMGLSHLLVESGATGAWFPTCCDGPTIDFVLDGSLTLTYEDQVQVLRADGTLEEIAAETEIVLETGDAVITRNQSEFTYANTGAAPAEVLEWLYLDDRGHFFAGRQLPGWGGPGGLDATYVIPLFTDPVRVTLKRHVLDPGEGVEAARIDGIRQVVTPNLETEILFMFGDETFVAVDSGGQQTVAYSIEVAPAGVNSDLQQVGLPPE